MSRARWIASAAGAAVLLLGLGSRVDAQTVKRVPVKPIAAVAGSVSFKAYCTVCHGIGGKGDGPAAKALTVPPADLTRLAARHEGKFPRDAVRMAILGEQILPAHGTRDMPMWGPVFRSVDSPEVTALRVHNLVDYVESIQEKR
jgi:mono/diheme cytochrome c family protein